MIKCNLTMHASKFMLYNWSFTNDGKVVIVVPYSYFRF